MEQVDFSEAFQIKDQIYSIGQMFSLLCFLPPLSTSKFSSTYVMSRDEILAAINADNRNWLNAPWVVAEFYFYRRIVEAFKFFETGYDMFAKQKQVHAM